MNNLNGANFLKSLSNVPEPREEDKLWLQASTATREDKEIVVVKMAPSGMFNVFADEYVSTIDKFFVGLFSGNRPQIVDSTYFAGKGLTEEQIIMKYANTILWATIAANKRQYQKEAYLKTLFRHIQSQRVTVPVLLINAINCVGPVDIAEKAIRLEVELADGWDYKNEILSLEQFVAVSSWFDQLAKHGFDCVEYVKLGADGVRDFMMMTLETAQMPSPKEVEQVSSLQAEGEEKSEEVADGKKKTVAMDYSEVKFVIRSEKIAANIVGLYRYFFYTEKVKYLSDSRRIFKYGTYETTEAAVRSIVKTMLKIDKDELFSGANSLAHANKMSLETSGSGEAENQE